MLKNPHDFAPYFAPKIKLTKQKQKQTNKQKKPFASSCLRFILQRSVWLTRNMNFKHIQERNQNTNAINIHIMNLFRDWRGKKE